MRARFLTLEGSEIQAGHGTVACIAPITPYLGMPGQL